MSDPVDPAKRPSRLWGVLTVVAGLYLVAFGGFVMSVGQADDSPGLGALGLTAAVIGIVMGVRALRR